MDTTPKVLVVDDNKEITDLLSRYFLEYKDEFTTISTNHPEEVLKILGANNEVQLIVTDFKMGAINGLELLLQVKDKFPEVQFIMMTGYGTPELREEVMNQGAVRFLEKPFQIHELVETIRDSLNRKMDSAFSGLIDSLQFVDIIQFLGVSGGDAKLSMEADGQKGHIYFQGGNVIHAECGKLSGLEAFYEMFAWQGGSFVVADFDQQITHTINKSWQGLLLDATRMDDERKVKQTQDSAKVAADTPQINIPDESEALAAFGIGGLEPTPKPKGQPQPAPAPKPKKDVTALGFKDIENALDRCIDYYMQFYPATAKDGVAVSQLSLKELLPVLRRHLIFYFHHVSTSAVKTEDLPFDFTHPKVAEAAIKLIEALLESWIIKPGNFKELLGEAISFQVARSVYPAMTVADFLETRAEKNVKRTKAILSSLLIKRVIENDYAPLLNYLDKYPTPEIESEEIVSYIQNMFKEKGAKDGHKMMMSAIERLTEIFRLGAAEPKMALEQEVIVAMLEGRGLKDLAAQIKKQIPDPNTPVTLDEYDKMIKPMLG